ncbi:ParA family protein [Desulfonatronovibrio hydrogenovorans]|uniref:ParA family protein n=1 Tax=Desulfonatronovibrio hydrogenovorans TaxID=53245 RepID=UPI00054FEA2D|nr:ParA family protein [Desulfonatronovibrio hydrogenovorans]
MKIISFANYKGGVGKTTSVVNTARVLAEKNKKVLVIDLDPQGNSTLTLSRSNPFEHEKTVGDLLSDKDLSIRDCLVETPCGVDLIPTNLHSYPLVSSLPANSAKRIYGLKNKLNDLQEDYDYVLVDCPPQIEGALITNAIAASDYYVLPIEGESVYALQGVDHLIQAIDLIREDSGSGIRLLGALVTMVDTRTKAGQMVMEAINRYFKDMVFKAVIRRNTTINKANLSNKCVCDLDPKSSGCADYRAFAQELVSRIDTEIKNK